MNILGKWARKKRKPYRVAGTRVTYADLASAAPLSNLSVGEVVAR
jgi:hypothetical protein